MTMMLKSSKNKFSKNDFSFLVKADITKTRKKKIKKLWRLINLKIIIKMKIILSLEKIILFINLLKI